MRGALLVFLAGTVWGQSFEVASVRPNRTGARGGSLDFPAGRDRLSMTNMPLGALILTAYDLTVRQLSGPGELLSERYDIQAKSETPGSADTMRGMLRALLAERFRLVAHWETREVPVYALTVAKNGPKLRESDAAAVDAPRMPAHAAGAELATGHLTFHGESMPDFAWALSRMAGIGERVVVDQTGLQGRYDFELTFAREPESPSLFAAIPEQLGLKLEPKKAPVRFLIVDRLERPTAN
jgi:uncharacterized protein (TIGR03435 family)